MVSTQSRERAAEIGKTLNFGTMERAYREGMNLSRWLEKEDPSDGYNDGLDAFERQLSILGITTRSNHERGFYADPLSKFVDAGDAGRVLMIEWMARQYRNATNMSRQQQQRVFSTDSSEVGGIMRPYVDAAQARYSRMAPAIPLSELVATTTRINGNVYRALYLNPDDTKVRMVRVGEAAEIPGVTVREGERPIDLFKYGRKLKFSYESLRNTPIDRVAFLIALMAVQAEVDKVSTVIDIIVNGDGNSGTAAEVIDLTTLDSTATPNTLTLKAWLAFKMAFGNPYALTHELAQQGPILQQLLLNTGSANIPVLALSGAANFGGFTPMNPALSDSVRYGVTEEAPANQIVALDARYAIEHVSEIGGTIQESMNWITNQTRDLVMTETEGFAVMDSKATKILDLTS